MDNNTLNEKELEKVNGGSGSSFKYVFYDKEQIWGDAAHTRYFVINEDVKTNDDYYEFSVTVFESSLKRQSQITSSAYTIGLYLANFGKKA